LLWIHSVSGEIVIGSLRGTKGRLIKTDAQVIQCNIQIIPLFMK
jgi:hypothetical protein